MKNIEGKWITNKKSLHEFAKQNDGECVIAKVKFFTDGGGNPYANCAFSSPDEAKKREAVDWDWYFTDEPFVDDRWKLEEE